MQLFVLGMHRSGTSAVTSLLHGMGAYAGPSAQDIGASEENPKGFFERRDVIDLNAAILSAVGADWHRVSRFDLARLEPDAGEDVRRRIDAIVTELDSRKPWVLKDPRLCLTLPLWLERCPRAIVVFVHRCPIEVAGSLRARNDFPHSCGIALWERYNVEALHHRNAARTIGISYHDLMTSPRATAARLHADLVAAGVEGLRAPTPEIVGDRIDTTLYRNRTDPEIVEEFLNPRQLELLRTLEADLESAGNTALDVPLTMSGGGQVALEEFELEIEAATPGERSDGTPGERCESTPTRSGMSPRYQRLETQLHEMSDLQRRTAEKRTEAEQAYQKAKTRNSDLEQAIAQLRDRAALAEERYRLAKQKRDEAIESYRRERARSAELTHAQAQLMQARAQLARAQALHAGEGSPI